LRVVRVVPDVPAVSDRRFDYLVPQSWVAPLRPGSRVRIPLGGRRVGAWVREVDVEPTPGMALRQLTRYSGLGPPPSVLGLAEWAAWRWAMPLATLLRTASPERNVTALPPAPRPMAPSGAMDAARHSADWPRPPGGGPWPAGPSLVRVGPASDLLGLVLEVIAQAEGPVLVLAPSVGWAGRLAGRLRRRGLAVADDWTRAAAGWPVVVGSRAAAWAPIPRLGGAVVLDAHSYKDRYDAAEVVAERATRDGAPCVLASPCPTAVQADRWAPVLTAPRPRERGAWPAITVVDRRGADPRTGLYSEELVRLAHRVLPERVVFVLNRTGRARLLACASCGELARCERCGKPVELVDGDVDGLAELACRSCGARRPEICARCGGMKMKVLRQGVSRAREELASLLGVPVGEVAGPLPERGATAAEERAGLPETPVLVGTEAVLHRVRHAGAVAFLDIDQHLLAPRFTAAEESLALLALAGRLVGPRHGAGPVGTAGSSGTPGMVLVQTRLPDHEVLAAAAVGDPGLVTERQLRRELDLPPASALATIRSATEPTLAGVEISPLSEGRWLARAPDHQILCDALASLHGGARVDPTDV